MSGLVSSLLKITRWDPAHLSSACTVHLGSGWGSKVRVFLNERSASFLAVNTELLCLSALKNWAFHSR